MLSEASAVNCTVWKKVEIDDLFKNGRVWISREKIIDLILEQQAGLRDMIVCGPTTVQSNYAHGPKLNMHLLYVNMWNPHVLYGGTVQFLEICLVVLLFQKLQLCNMCLFLSQRNLVSLPSSDHMKVCKDW